MTRRALITGITGQDGAYLAEFLLEKATRCTASSAAPRCSTPSASTTSTRTRTTTTPRFVLHYGDLTDSSNLTRIMQQVQPDEIYNLGAQSHVAVSFEEPEYTADVDALGTLRLLEAIRILGLERQDALLPGLDLGAVRPGAGDAAEGDHAVLPALPYAVAKLYAYWITVNYREAYGMYACNGILFNHESPAPRRDLRHAQDHPRPGAHRARPARTACTSATSTRCATGAMRGLRARCSG